MRVVAVGAVVPVVEQWHSEQATWLAGQPAAVPAVCRKTAVDYIYLPQKKTPFQLYYAAVECRAILVYPVTVDGAVPATKLPVAV